MKTRLLLLGCLLAVASHAQSTKTEVWEWTDANGVRHFSDAPAPGARKMVIVGDSARPSAPSTPSARPATPAGQAAAKPAAQQAVEYSSLEIWSPENGASFFGADAVVVVRLRSEPELAPGDRLLTYLDGKLAEPENAYEHSFANLDRGVHSVTSVILDARGNEKIRSEPLVFHIKQPTVINNPQAVGPAVRPRPQPR
jgi:hypothetical protein